MIKPYTLRWTQVPQDLPRWPQYDPNTAQDGPKVGPNSPGVTPRQPQDGFNFAQDDILWHVTYNVQLTIRPGGMRKAIRSAARPAGARATACQTPIQNFKILSYILQIFFGGVFGPP